jgi:hypothetical protein
MITDRNLARKRLTHVIMPADFMGLQVTGSSTVVHGFGTGLPPWTEVSAFGFGGVNMEVGDMIACLDFFTPIHADVTEDIGVRVLWTENDASPAATDAVTFIALYDQADLGEALIEPATALDTPLVEHVPGDTTGFQLLRTARGIIAANSLDATAKNGSIAWRVEADAVTTYSTDEITVLGLQIDYMPHSYMNSSETTITHAASGNSES